LRVNEKREDSPRDFDANSVADLGGRVAVAAEAHGKGSGVPLGMSRAN